jgi:hypothetical protein
LFLYAFSFIINLTNRLTSFAYPYGVWNRTAADSIKNIGFTIAFIVYEKQDASVPLYIIKRIIVKNTWSTKEFLTDQNHIPL